MLLKRLRKLKLSSKRTRKKTQWRKSLLEKKLSLSKRMRLLSRRRQSLRSNAKSSTTEPPTMSPTEDSMRLTINITFR